MAINVTDLPPAYQAQALRKLMEQELVEWERRKKRTQIQPTSRNVPVSGRKYRNKPTERVTASGAVIRFDSQKEARRYDHLIALEQAGQIRDLRLQVDFTLQEAYTDTEGRRVRAIRYKADFVYLKQVPPWETDPEWSRGKPIWRKVVEDVKSSATRTKTYIMKRKMMKDRLGIDVQEV